MKSPERTEMISQGLIKQLIEQLLLSVGKIKYDDIVEISLPWTEDLIPVKFITYKQEQVKILRHG
jgi:hypothetical protein